MHPIDSLGIPAAVIVGVPLAAWLVRGVVAAVLDLRDEREAQGSVREWAAHRRALGRAVGR